MNKLKEIYYKLKLKGLTKSIDRNRKLMYNYAAVKDVYNYLELSYNVLDFEDKRKTIENKLDLLQNAS